MAIIASLGELASLAMFSNFWMRSWILAISTELVIFNLSDLIGAAPAPPSTSIIT